MIYKAKRYKIININTKVIKINIIYKYYFNDIKVKLL